MPLRAPKGFIDENDPAVCKIGHPAPAWLVNYADLMTEMVCFFVILYALSAALNKDIQGAAERVKEMMEKSDVKGETKITKDGLQISLEEKGGVHYFAMGSADLSPQLDKILADLAPSLRTLAEKNHDIIVEGHTDNIPIGRGNEYFSSNWELSTARATTVVEQMIVKYGFPPDKMAAMGYGEHRPIAPNDTPDNRSRNRRVVFFVKNQPLNARPAASAEPSPPDAQARQPEPLETPAPEAPPPEAPAETPGAVQPPE